MIPRKHRTIAALLMAGCGSLGAAAAERQGPVQIFVAADGKCAATLQPGRVDLGTLFPAAELVFKGPVADAPGRRYQSCEVTVPQETFLAEFGYCALASFSAGSCWISYTAEGGRNVRLSVISDGGEDAPVAAHCGFVCLKR